MDSCKNLPAVRFADFNDPWEEKRLGEVADYIRGVTYKKYQEINSGENGIKILRANNITLNSNTLNFDDVKVVSHDVKVKESQWLHREDILICAGNGSKEHIGKVAYIKDDIKCAFGGFMGVVRTASLLNKKFLFHVLTSPNFKTYLSKYVLSATTINNLNSQAIQNYLIPLPPLAEQRKIGEFFGGLDNLIDLWRGKLEKLKNIKKALLEKMLPN